MTGQSNQAFLPSTFYPETFHPEASHSDTSYTGRTDSENSHSKNKLPESFSNRYSFQSFSNNANSLDLLLSGLNQYRRWVYHFCHDFKIKCNYNNVMQVRYQSESPLIEWIEKVLNAGQCSAILLEKQDLDEFLLKAIKNMCEEASVMLVVIEPQACTIN